MDAQAHFAMVETVKTRELYAQRLTVVLGCAGDCNQGRRPCDCWPMWGEMPGGMCHVPAPLTWKQRLAAWWHRHVISKEVH